MKPRNAKKQNITDKILIDEDHSVLFEASLLTTKKTSKASFGDFLSSLFLYTAFPKLSKLPNFSDYNFSNHIRERLCGQFPFPGICILAKLSIKLVAFFTLLRKKYAYLVQ
jgi:hypothetical protein